MFYRKKILTFKQFSPITKEIYSLGSNYLVSWVSRTRNDLDKLEEKGLQEISGTQTILLASLPQS